MKGQLKNIDMNSHVSLDDYFPDDEKCFGLWLTALIGKEGSSGGDYFQLLVCTPNWIKKEYSCQKAVWGQHMLIVFEYDLNIIKKELNSYLDKCIGDTWLSIAQKVGRIAAWEFEDYQP
jgi:hypothetical protein